MSDNVNHPNHYTECSLECIEVMRIAFGDSAVYNFCVCNAFKYLWRYKFKNNGEDDLKKAEWYVNYAEGLEIYQKDRTLQTYRTLQTLKQILANAVK